MAQPVIRRGSRLNIMVGDGASPEAFTIVCSLETRNFNRQINTNDHYVADCEDPEALADRFTLPTGRMADLSGSGKMNTAQAALLDDLLDGLPHNYRIDYAPDGGDTNYDGYFEGQFVLTGINDTGADATQGNYITRELSWKSYGPLTWVDRPAG